MTCESKTWLLLHLLLLAACYMQHCVHGIVTPTQTSQVPCLFIFGDSLADNGNNNLLSTTAKANYKPYGIDFPTGPTGRFTNGATTIDIIGEMLGFKDYIPPFANTTGSNILKGVNYASGSAGIRDETGKKLGANIPLRIQINNHKIIVSQIALKLGGMQQAINYLGRCLYYVNIGSNDYINNYYEPNDYPTSHIYNPEQYAEALIDQLSLNLQTLRSDGARKLVLVGLGAIGCTPHAIATSGILGACAENQNVDALMFSQKLRSLVEQFNNLYLDSKSIFINSTSGKLDESLGFTVTTIPCCLVRSDGMCVEFSMPCMNRTRYVSYDGFHPTSAVNYLFALTSYDSSFNPETTYPMDIKQLAQHLII